MPIKTRTVATAKASCGRNIQSPAHPASRRGRLRIQIYRAFDSLPDVFLKAWRERRRGARRAQQQRAQRGVVLIKIVFFHGIAGGLTAFGSASSDQSRHLDYTASAEIPRNYSFGFCGAGLPPG